MLCVTAIATFLTDRGIFLAIEMRFFAMKKSIEVLVWKSTMVHRVSQCLHHSSIASMRRKPRWLSNDGQDGHCLKELSPPLSSPRSSSLLLLMPEAALAGLGDGKVLFVESMMVQKRTGVQRCTRAWSSKVQGVIRHM